MSDASPGSDWIRPVAHELGNLLAGVRLTAHFLGDEPRQDRRRRWTGDIELLTTQAGAWVALLRPLQGGELHVGACASDELLAAARLSVFELLPTPEALRLPRTRTLPPLRADVDAVHQLLVLILTGALAEGDEPHLRIELREEGRFGVISVLDDAPPIPEIGIASSPRGRELVLGVGDSLLRAFGGRLEHAVRRKGNRVELWLRRAPRARKTPTARRTVR